MNILSIMSGSSLDGLDLGVIEILESEKGIQSNIISCSTIPYSIHWKECLKNARDLSARELLGMDAEYAIHVATLISKFREEYNGSEIEAISFHGHTIYHHPEERFTYQLGNCAILAAHTNLKTVGNYRNADVGLGGQGAPLMAIVDKLLYKNYSAFINLGGICNITTYNMNKSAAYDIGPCNQILNFIASREGIEYDKDAILSRKGQVKEDLLGKLLADPYLNKSAPKSLDNNYIASYYFPILEATNISSADKARTSCRFIADIIMQEFTRLQKSNFIDNHSENKVLITGGGAFHPTLKNEISMNLQKVGCEAIFPSKDLIAFKELILMAVLAYLRLHSKPNVLAEFTGSTRNTISGGIYES